jgi:hypothetical protein
MSARTKFPGTNPAPAPPAGTGVLSAWGTTVVTGPIIVQRAKWGMQSSGATPESAAAELRPEDTREPTRAA